MKILLLNDEFYTTGASTAMLRLAERLMPNHEVSVMPRIDGDGEIKKQFQALGIPIVDNVKQVDLVVANTLMAGVHVAEAGPRCPVVWWIHEAEVGRDLLIRYPQLSAGFKHAMQIVFQTEYQKIVYGSYLFDSPAQVEVLPFWNDAIYKNPAVKPAPKQKKRVVCIGTVEPRKRMEDTVLAIDALDPAIKEQVECLFIGKYLEMTPAVKRMIDINPERYRLMGEQDNQTTMAYLASADAFVLASLSESQPLTIWEAFELEIPVCVSDLETYRHVGLRHGRNALMHPVGNIDMLAANLRTLLTNNRVGASISKGGKSLLLNALSKDWGDEFEAIIRRTSTRWEVKAIGY